MAGPYQRVAANDPGNSGATSATTLVNAHSAGLEALEAQVAGGLYLAPPAVMTSPPTITVGASGAATSISGATTTAPSSAVFTYLGAAMSNVGTLGSYANCYRQNANTYHCNHLGQFLNVEFETDADSFEVIVRTESATSAYYRVMVNGEYASAAEAQISTTSGEYRRILVAFGSSTSRRIRFEAQGVSFCGVAKHPTRTLWATARITGPVAVSVSDSYGMAAPATGTGHAWVWGNYLYRAGFYLGWDVYPSPVGGTGFQNDNWGNDTKYGDRLTTDVVNVSPDIVVVQASVNDPNGPSFSLATVQANVNSYFSSLRSALPSATVYGIGGIVANSVSYTNMATIGGYVSTACAANSATYIDSLTWIGGSGRAGATNGTGNSDYYTTTDGVHLTTAGYSYVVERLTGAIGSLTGRRANP